MKVTVTEIKKEYLIQIKPYLRYIINDLQKSGARKVLLIVAINFISPKNINEEYVVRYPKSDNKEFTTSYNVNNVVDKPFESVLSRSQIGLEASMRGSGFTFNSVQLLYYKCHKVIFERGERGDWIKNKKVTIKGKCFQQAAMVALNHGEVKRDLQIISKIDPFVDKYSWKRIKYPSKIDDLELFGKNNPIIALDVLYIKEIEICPTYISKINSDCSAANKDRFTVNYRHS